MVTFIIPCYNESKRMLSSLQVLSTFFPSQQYSYELIFIDDGSVDDTASIIVERIDSNIINAKLFSYKKNKGKGFAVKYGVENASVLSEYFFFMDCDLATSLNEIQHFLDIVHNETNNVVIGSRLTTKSHRTFIKKILGRVASFITNLLLDLEISDTQCGFKIFPSQTRSIFEHLTIDRFGFDMELLYLLKKKGYKILEIPVQRNEIAGSKVRIYDYRDSFCNLLYIRRKYE